MAKNSFLIISFFFINISFSEDTIFFIYNSQDDFYTLFSDTIHKTFKPETYPCQLCKLTYNTFNKKKKWRTFLSELNYEYIFLYKHDKFIAENKIIDFPLIMIGSNKDPKILLLKRDINKNTNLDELINMIDVRLKEYEAVN